jgi:hypothetical protein
VNRVKSFRLAIGSTLIFFFIAGTTLGLLLVSFDVGWRAALRFSPRAAIWGLTFSFVMALLFHWSFPTRISAEGLSAHSIYGFRRFISWENISDARPFRLFNLRWVRLYSSFDGKVTWMALFQSNFELFNAEIRKFAPSHSPVLKFVK